MRNAAILIVLGCLALGGCAGGVRSGRPISPPVPGTLINASVNVVREVITDSARRRGSAITLVGNGLVLEAPLATTRAEVEDICGPHRPGRKTRIVLRTVREDRGTLLTEERYVVDGPSACFLPLTPEDASQSHSALQRIKATAEEIQRRIDTHASLQ